MSTLLWILLSTVLSIVSIFLLWVILSIKIVGPDEMAVKVIFGEPVEFCDSGWVFDLRLPLGKRFKCFLQRYPKKIYNLDYRAREVITTGGKYPPGSEGVQYNALKVTVDAAAYLNFPRERVAKFDKETHPLIKILRAGVPIEDEKLKNWTEEAVVGALRVVFAQMTWRQAVEDMKTINRKVNEVFLDADGALIRAGFREPGIKLVVKEIHLPKSVEDALTLPEKARLEADAAQKIAEKQAIELMETILHTMARNKGVTLEQIKEEIRANPKLQREFLQYAKKLHAQLEKAEKGAYFEFNAPGKSGFDKSILSLIALFLKGISPITQQAKNQETKKEKKEPKTLREKWTKLQQEVEEEFKGEEEEAEEE